MSKIKQHRKVKNLKLLFLSHHFVACYFFFNTLLFLFTSEKHTSISTTPPPPWFIESREHKMKTLGENIC